MPDIDKINRQLSVEPPGRGLFFWLIFAACNKLKTTCRAAGGTWKNHGAYVSCVTHAGKEFVQAGLIAERQKDALVRAAAQSVCGGKTEAEQRERSEREK